MSIAEEIDMLVGNARMEQWEKINEPDHDEGRRQQAIQDLNTAVDHLKKAWNYILEAATDIDGLPEADLIDPYEEKVSEIKSDLRRIADKIRYGR